MNTRKINCLEKFMIRNSNMKIRPFTNQNKKLSAFFIKKPLDVVAILFWLNIIADKSSSHFF